MGTRGIGTRVKTSARFAAAALGSATLVSLGAGSVTFSAAAQETGAGDEPRERSESQLARAGERGAVMRADTLSLERSEQYGEYLVDGSGRALYLLEGESDGESTCYDACAEQWPPLIVRPGELPELEAEPLEERLLGTTERRDGTFQVTFGGYPLYYYVRDAGAGEVTGQDVTDEWGEWYLVTPEGAPLEGADEG